MTAEHIIPEALGETEYLTAATCDTCRKETANAENVIGLSISPLLRRLGVQGKKKRTKTIRLKGIDHKGQSFSENRDILKTGLLAALPTSNEPPRMMTGAPQSNEVTISIIAIFYRHYIGPFRSPGCYMNINPLRFSKMLAKIAHATAIAILGTDTFIPALPEFIRGKDDNWANWVGKCPEKSLPRIHNDPIVSVKIYHQGPPHDAVLLGRIRLFEVLVARVI